MHFEFLLIKQLVEAKDKGLWWQQMTMRCCTGHPAVRGQPCAEPLFAEACPGAQSNSLVVLELIASVDCRTQAAISLVAPFP